MQSDGLRPVRMRTNSPLVIGLAILIYIAVLHYVHQHHIAPQFSYLQYTYRTPVPWRYTVAISLAVALALLLPPRVSRPSHFVVWTLFLVAILPSIVVPQFTKAVPPAEATTLALWASAAFALVAVLGTRRPVREFVPVVRAGAAFWAVVAATAAAGNLYLLFSGAQLELPSLNDVYGLRSEFAEVRADDAALGYLVAALVNVVNPLMIVRGLLGRRWFWLASGLLGQLLVYSTSGNKSAILSPVALLLAYLVFRAARRPQGLMLTLGAAGLSVAMVVADWVSATNDWTSLIVRRFIITPGLLTAGYVAVFGPLDKVYLSHSILSGWLRYPYVAEPPDLVGAEFFGRSETHANANLLADGFANFGYGGMVIECLVLVVLLWVIDDATRGLPLGVAALLFLMPTLALVDGGVFTWVLSDGLAVALLAAACAPRTGWAPPRPARAESGGRADTGRRPTRSV